MIAGAKRRRRIMEYNASVRANNAAQRNQREEVHVIVQQQPPVGQPVQQNQQ